MIIVYINPVKLTALKFKQPIYNSLNAIINRLEANALLLNESLKRTMKHISTFNEIILKIKKDLE
jgi:hypothetical protein